jgi:hypothetical protein
VAEIAAQTKIKASLLEGLERDDISQWPAGIFRRAYVRAYALAIGFDADAAVREFLSLYPDAVEPIESPAPPPTRLRSLVDSALGTFRRRTAPPSMPSSPPSPVVPAVPSLPPPAQTAADVPTLEIPIATMTPPPAPADVVTATVGKRRAERSGPLELSLHLAEEPMPSGAAQAVTPTMRVPEGPTETADTATEPLVATSRSAASREQTAGTGDVEARPEAAPQAPEPVRRVPDFLAAAKICTELGRVDDIGQVPALLRDVAKILGARGLIVWVWNGGAEELRPVLVHGYPAKVRARLRGVAADADNVTAAAYRASAPLAVNGALAIPLLAPAGCAGVLAVEVPAGAEEDAQLRAVATFFAAMLAQLVGGAADSRSTADDAPRRTPLEARPG